MQYGAPAAVLVDQGTAFTSKKFEDYVCKYLTADVIYTRSGYPQGNAINESVHKGIEASIVARRQYDSTTKFEQMLSDAVLAYNSTPHSSTGHSPYFMMSGMELTLPGFHRCREDLAEDQRFVWLREMRNLAMMRAVLDADDSLRLYRVNEFKVGDLVVYYLKPQEREGVGEEGKMLLVKFSPSWSLPTKVERIGENTVDVFASNGKSIIITKRLVRRVGTNVPPSLQPLSEAILKREPPKPKIKPDWELIELKKRKLKAS